MVFGQRIDQQGHDPLRFLEEETVGKEQRGLSA
jgi:hypothetical protein